ncbi:MAG: methyltransferase [Desulfovibrio sp.]|nr:methyltransferase [Desulfovibrio sp.]
MSRPHPRPPAVIAVNAIMETGRIRFTLCGRDWVLLRPACLEVLWETLDDGEFGDDERLPYWVELWPSSLALAVWLKRNQNRIIGRNCLELGCGLGFTSLIGAYLGAKVLAMDYNADALSFARQNAEANALPHPLWVLMDWRKPAVAPKSCDFIWGGDIIYEDRFVEPIFAFLDYTLADNGRAWIAEPGRITFERFKTTLLAEGWRFRRMAGEYVDALYAQKIPVSVNLWELSRK